MQIVNAEVRYFYREEGVRYDLEATTRAEAHKEALTTAGGPTTIYLFEEAGDDATLLAVLTLSDPEA